eukprot:5120547-Pleurochrysis_carterae.AAC.2
MLRAAALSSHSKYPAHARSSRLESASGEQWYCEKGLSGSESGWMEVLGRTQNAAPLERSRVTGSPRGLKSDSMCGACLLYTSPSPRDGLLS